MIILEARIIQIEIISDHYSVKKSVALLCILLNKHLLLVSTLGIRSQTFLDNFKEGFILNESQSKSITILKPIGQFPNWKPSIS